MTKYTYPGQGFGNELLWCSFSLKSSLFGVTRGDGETFRWSLGKGDCLDADNGNGVDDADDALGTTAALAVIGDTLFNGDKVFLFKEGAVTLGPLVITEVVAVTAGEVIEQVVFVLSVMTEDVDRAQVVVVGDVVVVEARVLVEVMVRLLVEEVVTVVENELLHVDLVKGKTHSPVIKLLLLWKDFKIWIIKRCTMEKKKKNETCKIRT